VQVHVPFFVPATGPFLLRERNLEMAKSMSAGAGQTVHNGNKGRPQVRPVRKDGWTAAKRGAFLDHIAATCNVTAAAQLVGMGSSSAHKLRRVDPEFSEQWRAALDAGFDRLQAMLIERAMGPMKVEIGETPMPDVAAMDTELAMRLIEHHRRTIAGIPKRRGGPVPTRATEEETNAALLKRLKILHKRYQKEAADAEPTDAEHFNEAADTADENAAPERKEEN
jgi:molybdenum-dependent DNA-binding transcriptional regulator ModE